MQQNIHSLSTFSLQWRRVTSCWLCKRQS